MSSDVVRGGGTATRALVVYPHLRAAVPEPGEARRSPEARLAEAVGLTEAIEVDVVAAEIVPLTQLRPATLIGKGSVERLAEIVEEQEIAVAVFDAAVTPVQQRNLEKSLK